MGLMTRTSTLLLLLQIFLFCSFISLSLHVKADEEADFGRVTRDQRRSIVKTDYGEISAADISDGLGHYHLQFFTLEPNALFLPTILHGEMVLYCHSGSGNLHWTDHSKRQVNVSLVRGDVYRVRPGSAFYIESNVDEGLRTSAIFATADDDLHAPSIGAYSSISDMVRGFDKSVLQAAFKVPEEVIETIKNATKQPPIIQNVARGSSRPFRDWETRFVETIIGINGYTMASNKNKKEKEGRTFNVFREDRDVENCNGWSLTVTRKQLQAFDDSQFGVFYVNLSTGAMMGPHWNPLATEIAMVVAGQGMIRSVCPSIGNAIKCNNTRFRVKEGDVFVVPRYHPMAQMSFNNESFVFVGFSTTRKKNYPQYLAGKASVLQVIDKKVLSVAFNVDNATIEKLLTPQKDAIILECTSCAEGEYRALEEEMERKRQEEEAREQEEEEKRREEEEEERRRREEEEARKREEEEERRRQEEEAEQRKREEETAREEERTKREEQERQQREEEARRKQEEEQRKQQEEQARREKEREEQERQQREEEARREQEEEQRRQQEEEQARRERESEEQERQEREKEAEQEQEEARRQEQERQQREEEARREQEEEQRRQQEEEQARRERESEEQERQEREKEAEQEQEEARRQEQERQKREEAAWREQEDEQRRQQEKQASREREEVAREQEEREHTGEEERRAAAGGGSGESEEEMARKQEEERQRREREQGGGDGGQIRPVKKIWKI